MAKYGEGYNFAIADIINKIDIIILIIFGMCFFIFIIYLLLTVQYELKQIQHN